MQLHIHPETCYRYDEPVKRSVQSLRLTPRREPIQRALQWEISAPGRQTVQIDAHGNVSHLLTVDNPHREIRISVSGVVETTDAHGLLPDDGRLSPLAYVAESPLTRSNHSIQEFAAKHLPAREINVARLLALSEAICERIRYERGATEVNDAAALAFERGRGVCQDHAHVFIACCRLARIPARYVSGYYYPGETEHVASHAWVDVWLGQPQGWFSIDVTHRSVAGEQHCRLAVGRDYLDACPVRGVRRGGGSESMQVAVHVSAAALQQQQ